MYLIEIFLPLYDGAGARFPQTDYAATRDELVTRFGGLTAHSLTPVAGLWEDPHGNVVRDDIIVYEVIAERVEKSWWSNYREALQQRFKQSQLLIRCSEIAIL